MILEWLNAAGLSSLKPVASALLLPPVPWLALALVGAWCARRRPRAGGSLVVLACGLLWLSACSGAAQWLEQALLPEPPAIDAAQRAALKAEAAGGARMAIVALGGGVEPLAPEYGTPTLSNFSYARLRYAVWLSHQTGIPLAASGGTGWAGTPSTATAEATLMASIARDEFGLPLRWVEARSRDTRENAANTVALLKSDGIGQVLLVTHGWHMPRALREFEAAASAGGAPGLRVRAAPMGLAYPDESALLRWMPSGDGAQRMRAVTHEVLAAAIAAR